jgi:hypothetical protein
MFVAAVFARCIIFRVVVHLRLDVGVGGSNWIGEQRISTDQNGGKSKRKDFHDIVDDCDYFDDYDESVLIRLVVLAEFNRQKFQSILRTKN